MKHKILTIKITETEYVQLSRYISEHAGAHNQRECRLKVLIGLCDEEGIEIPERIKNEYEQLVAIGEVTSKFLELFPSLR